MAINTDQARIFDMYDHMFAEDAWKDLVGDFIERRERLKDSLLSSKTNERDLDFAKGQNSVYSYVIELERMLERAKVEALKQSEEQSALPDFS